MTVSPLTLGFPLSLSLLSLSLPQAHAAQPASVHPPCPSSPSVTFLPSEGRSYLLSDKKRQCIYSEPTLNHIFPYRDESLYHIILHIIHIYYSSLMAKWSHCHLHPMHAYLVLFSKFCQADSSIAKLLTSVCSSYKQTQ